MPIDDGITHEQRHAPMGKNSPQKTSTSATTGSDNTSDKVLGGASLN